MPFLALWSAVLNQTSTFYVPSCPERAGVSRGSSPALCLAPAAGESQLESPQLQFTWRVRRGRERWTLSQNPLCWYWSQGPFLVVEHPL